MREKNRTETVIAAVRTRIASGSLARGERLPSIRRLASQHGFSPSTIAEAYDRLVAEGMIHARPGSGYFVAGGTLARFVPNTKRDHAVDPFWVSRQALEADPSIMQPGCGWLPESWMPLPALRHALRAISREEGVLLTGYGPARGSLPLRQLLTRRWAEDQLHVAPEQILLTSSGTQAVDLVCRLMLSPGDTVLVDDPCYFNFRALLAEHRVRVIGVPCLADGPDLDAFARLLRQEAPMLYLTNSGLQNPVGCTITLHKAHEILSLAKAHGVTIIEDDIFADFAPRPFASLAPLDGLNRVIRIGSFSKTLSASLRCGYIAASSEMIERLGDLLIATGFAGVSPVAAEIVKHVLTGGSYRRHIEALHRRLAKARKDGAGQLGSLGIKPVIMPEGGFSLWCEMPAGCDVTDLARNALEEGIVLAPGAVFSASGETSRFMRFNVAQMAENNIIGQLAVLLGRGASSG
ncbi:PLP-dependent aminotransferase family protein [Asaia siamensis]|nr:PLP-dependent aminotransferase family protein [Asaia siamensis]GBR10732.1 transcriptional regulator [Asaia siamensis NRIC 0323]